jgi:hypothetical protein
VNFFKIWWMSITRPAQMTEELRAKPAPLYGFIMVLIRFVITSLTSLLALYFLHRIPFAPSRLAFLPTEEYYRAEIFFLPLWGIGIWLLMGGLGHLSMKLLRKPGNYDQALNIIGMGMLTPMPLLWLWDWLAIALNIYGVLTQAISHSIAQLWEATVQTIGFKKILGLGLPTAALIAVLINALYISLAMMFIR